LIHPREVPLRIAEATLTHVMVRETPTVKQRGATIQIRRGVTRQIIELIHNSKWINEEEATIQIAVVIHSNDKVPQLARRTKSIIVEGASIKITLNTDKVPAKLISERGASIQIVVGILNHNKVLE
jgi:hypothetical protein